MNYVIIILYNHKDEDEMRDNLLSTIKKILIVLFASIIVIAYFPVHSMAENLDKNELKSPKRTLNSSLIEMILRLKKQGDEIKVDIASKKDTKKASKTKKTSLKLKAKSSFNKKPNTKAKKKSNPENKSSTDSSKQINSINLNLLNINNYLEKKYNNKVNDLIIRAREKVNIEAYSNDTYTIYLNNVDDEGNIISKNSNVANRFVIGSYYYQNGSRYKNTRSERYMSYNYDRSGNLYYYKEGLNPGEYYIYQLEDKEPNGYIYSKKYIDVTLKNTDNPDTNYRYRNNVTNSVTLNNFGLDKIIDSRGNKRNANRNYIYPLGTNDGEGYNEWRQTQYDRFQTKVLNITPEAYEIKLNATKNRNFNPGDYFYLNFGNNLNTGKSLSLDGKKHFKAYIDGVYVADGNTDSNNEHRVIFKFNSNISNVSGNNLVIKAIMYVNPETVQGREEPNQSYGMPGKTNNIYDSFTPKAYINNNYFVNSNNKANVNYSNFATKVDKTVWHDGPLGGRDRGSTHFNYGMRVTKYDKGSGDWQALMYVNPRFATSQALVSYPFFKYGFPEGLRDNLGRDQGVNIRAKGYFINGDFIGYRTIENLNGNPVPKDIYNMYIGRAGFNKDMNYRTRVEQNRVMPFSFGIDPNNNSLTKIAPAKERQEWGTYVWSKKDMMIYNYASFDPKNSNERTIKYNQGASGALCSGDLGFEKNEDKMKPFAYVYKIWGTSAAVNNYNKNTPLVFLMDLETGRQKDPNVAKHAEKFMKNYKFKVNYDLEVDSPDNSAGLTKTVNFTNFKNKVVFKNLVKDTDRPIGGSRFNLFSYKENNYIYTNTTAGSNGEVWYDELPPGNYRLDEDRVGDGYTYLDQNNKKYTFFTVKDNGRIFYTPKDDKGNKTNKETLVNYVNNNDTNNYSDLVTKTIPVYNMKKPLIFTKYGYTKKFAKGSYEGLHKLEDATFGLYKWNNDKYELVYKNNEKFIVQSDSEGEFNFGNLEDGYYKVEEVESADGYKFDDEVKKANSLQFYVKNGISYYQANNREIRENDNSLNFYNPLGETVNVTINKVDEDGNPLAGAKIKISSSDIEKEGITGEDGILKFTVPKGEVRVEEVDPPKGYVKNPKVIIIPVGKKYTVPKDVTNARDVSKYIKVASFDTKDTLINPIYAELMNVDSKLLIDDALRNGSKKAKPGDYFKLYFNGPVTLGGLTPNDQQTLDIHSSLGTVCKGKFFKDDKGLGYQFTFTDYVKDLKLRHDIKLFSQLYVDTDKVKGFTGCTKNNPEYMTISARVGDSTMGLNNEANNQVGVYFDGWARFVDVGTALGSRITGYDPENKTITQLIYIQPRGGNNQYINGISSITIDDRNGDNVIGNPVDTTIYQVVNPSQETMPMSYGVKFSDFTNITYQFNASQITRNNGKLNIKLSDKYFEGKGLLIKNVYHFKDKEKGNKITLHCKLNYETYGWDNYYKYWYMNYWGYITYQNYILVQHPKGTVDGDLAIQIENHKKLNPPEEHDNHIDLVKVSDAGIKDKDPDLVEGAEFIIEKNNPSVGVNGQGKQIWIDHWSPYSYETKDGGIVKDGIIKSGTNGGFSFYNLTLSKGKQWWNGHWIYQDIDGEYRIREIKTPQGFVPVDPNKVILKLTVPKSMQREIIISDNSTQLSDAREAKSSPQIINKKEKREYPRTGGYGSALFILIGIALMGAAIYLASKKKKI